MRLLVRVLIAEPELLVFGRIEVDVGVDQLGLCLGARRDGRQRRSQAQRAGAGEKAAPRRPRGTAGATGKMLSRFGVAHLAFSRYGCIGVHCYKSGHAAASAIGSNKVETMRTRC